MKKSFLPTFLYIKTHNKTGLKYFGKTTNDPYKYLGSGSYWRAHLKIHGCDISTEVIGYFTSEEECSKAAIEFSTKHNIITATNENNQKVWANQIIENGLDGGAIRFGPHSEETKQKISTSHKGKIMPDETKRKIKNARKNQKNVRKVGEWKQSESAKQKIREKRANQVITKESREKAANKLRGRKRPEISEKLRGRKHTPQAIENMKRAQQNRKAVSEETKQKIRKARQLQIFTDETREKLKGKIVCINRAGEIKKISKEEFYSQNETSDKREWVFHKSTEGILRKSRATLKDLPC